MSLIAERNRWREQMNKNCFERPYYLKVYDEVRHSEAQRMSKQAEIICEYALFLEDKIKELNGLGNTTGMLDK